MLISHGTNGGQPESLKVGLSEDNKHIVAIVPRGEVIRNFVYTGCLDEISSKVQLSTLTVSKISESDPALTALKPPRGNVFPLQEECERWPVRFQRELLEVAHGRWLWSKAAQERWRMRDLEAKTVWSRSSRLAKKILSYPFSNRIGLGLLSKSERVTSRFLRTSDEYIELFRFLRPTLVFNGSHIHSRNAIQAVQAAQWLGIPTATFIFSWDNLTSQGRIMLPYDYFLVWNEALRDQLLEMYHWVDPKNVFVTGTPQFDFHFRDDFYIDREEYFAKIGADPNRPLILYTTGMANHMPGEPQIVEQIADVLNQMDLPNRPQLMVRVYAKDLTGRFDSLRSRRKDILFPAVAWESSWLTPKYEDSYDLVNALRHCDAGINVASTVSLELCMFDKPVINIGYNPPNVPSDLVSYAEYYEFDHYKPVVDSGAVDLARSSSEIGELIRHSLQEPHARSNERIKLIRKMFGKTLDGNSAQRVADTLLQIAESTLRNN